MSSRGFRELPESAADRHHHGRLFGSRSIVGTLTGSAIENEDNLRFAQRHGIRSMNEVLPWSEAPKAYERMFSGQARFRMVLDVRA